MNRVLFSKAAIAAVALSMSANAAGASVATHTHVQNAWSLVSAHSSYRTLHDSGHFTGVGDVPSIKYVQCDPQAAGVCGGTAAGPDGPPYNLTSAYNSVTYAEDMGGAVALAGGSAVALADMASGKVGVAATSSHRRGFNGEYGHTAEAAARADDVLTFAAAGASVNNPVLVGVSFTMSGNWFVPNSGSAYAVASIRNVFGFGSGIADVNYQMDANGVTYQSVTASGWDSYAWGPVSPTFATFTGYMALTSASQVMGIYDFMSTYAGGGAWTSYDHTTQLSLILPKGVSYTSASGVFLTNTGGGTGGVPEPATWAMMILGFGAAGSMFRRQRNAFAG